jgi:hypothetical protein
MDPPNPQAVGELLGLFPAGNVNEGVVELSEQMAGGVIEIKRMLTSLIQKLSAEEG